jgi:hypothetical protein
VATDGEVAGDAGFAQVGGDAAELRQKELEDEREPDDQRLPARQQRRDLLAALADVERLRDTAVPLKHGREVPHAEIALVLISDQDHLGMAAPAHRLIRCGGIALARRGHIHRRSLQELGGLGRSVRNDATDLGLGLEPVGQQLLAESAIDLEHVLHVDRIEDRTRPPQDQCLQCSELCRAQGRTCRWLGHSYLPMKWRFR